MLQRILRLPEVKHYTSLSRSTIYSLISQKLWPTPILIAIRAVGWPRNEVIAIHQARIAGKSQQEIKSLVSQLEKARKSIDDTGDEQ